MVSKKTRNAMELETEILQDVSAEQLWTHVQYLASFDKTSGTEGEKRAYDYIIEKLAEYGVETETIKFESLLSHPVKASLTLLAPKQKVFKARPPAFSQITPIEGITGPLVYLGEGLEENLKTRDVSKKIGMIDGFPSPARAWRAQQAGMVALVAASKEDQIHEMIVTTIWGTPTTESAKRMPQIPVITIKKRDGAYLRNFKDPQVTVKAETSTEWRTIRIPVAHIRGKKEPEKFVLVEGHYDSWYLGATDNATGTACKLELAKIFQKHQDRLKRSVRLAWWPGHSTGRYSGSTYYVDNNWLDLYENAVAHINVDSPGPLWGTRYELNVMAELEQFEREIVAEQTGTEITFTPGAVKPGRPERDADQSFYGIGIPAMSAYPMLSADKMKAMGGSGGGEWWHTPDDTLDKVDKEILARDTRLYATFVFRLCNALILPFDFQNTVKDFQTTLEAIQEKVGDTIDFSEPLKYCETFKTQLSRFNEILLSNVRSRAEAPGDEKVEAALHEVNTCLMRLSRSLNPVLYTIAGKFEQDPAVSAPLLPGLQAAARLPALQTAPNEFKFLKTQLVRERHRVVHALHQATVLIKEKTQQIEALLK